jgi:hypothetical protein
VLNIAFSVRKCIVKPKEKIMVASYGETSGFSAVGVGELMLVNGGKSSSGGGSSGVTIGAGGISFPFGDGHVVVGGDLGSKTISATYTASK